MAKKIMITDKLSNSNSYNGLGQRFQAAFEYLKNTDLAAMEVGKYQIDGDNLYVMIQEYETKPLEKGRYEAHLKYADIQYIIAGGEHMGYAPLDAMPEAHDQNPEKDIYYYKDEAEAGVLLKIEAGMFALFLPQDVHMPNISMAGASNNKKAVVKVLM